MRRRVVHIENPDASKLNQREPFFNKVSWVEMPQMTLKEKYHALWDEWHNCTNPSHEWIDYFLQRVPGQCDCSGSFSSWIKANPPDFNNWFAYSVSAHNFVNDKLGYPRLSNDDALRVWSKQWAFTRNEDLLAATQALIRKLPPIRGVAGIPVSGMLVASIISTTLHVPLFEASVEFGLRRCAHGYRGSSRLVDQNLPLLIVDDTVSSGLSLLNVRDHLSMNDVIFGAAMVKPVNAKHVDFYGQLLDEPHLLEWNLANTGYIRHLTYDKKLKGEGIMLDFDGVLCEDPPVVFNESDEIGRREYLKWLSSARLGTFVPRMHSVPHIISWRCEYTRQATEAWLRYHHIKYEHLHLWQGEPHTRTWQARDWKGLKYRESRCGLFIESCDRQSKDIFEYSRKPVLCWDTRKLLFP